MIEYIVLRNSYAYSLIATMNDKIYALLLGEEKERLVQEIQALAKDKEIKEKEMADDLDKQVFFALEKPQDPHQEFPMILEGTDLQIKVWKYLMDNTIPGQTVTYSKIAQDIGAGKAYRAIGSACAKNKIAFLIPCHRVIGTNDKDTGYRWGMKLKSILLEKEKSKNYF